MVLRDEGVVVSAASPEILIVAAEASSALYAQRLIEYWKTADKPIHAFGIGSRAMESLGFEIVGRAEDLAVVGFTEVVKHYGQIRSVFYNLIKLVKERRPKAVLLMDYPDFNLRLAKKLKPLGVPIIYYISPQVWAWRKSRIKIIQNYVDKMLVVLPFERPFYQKHGVDVEFVGHPLLDEVNPKLFDPGERKTAREKYGVYDGEVWVGLMPGSRKSEIRHHLLTQIEAADLMWKQNPKLKFALLIAPSLSDEQIRTALPSYTLPLVLLRDDPMKMVSLMDCIVCASGTATLVVGLLRVPMVIMYKMSAFTAWLAKRIVKGIQYFGLVNLILDRKVVPELYQNEANPEQISREVFRYLDDKKYREHVVEELKKIQPLLGQQGATKRVSRLLEGIVYPT